MKCFGVFAFLHGVAAAENWQVVVSEHVTGFNSDVLRGVIRQRLEQHRHSPETETFVKLHKVGQGLPNPQINKLTNEDRLDLVLRKLDQHIPTFTTFEHFASFGIASPTWRVTVFVKINGFDKNHARLKIFQHLRQVPDLRTGPNPYTVFGQEVYAYSLLPDTGYDIYHGDLNTVLEQLREGIVKFMAEQFDWVSTGFGIRYPDLYARMRDYYSHNAFADVGFLLRRYIPEERASRLSAHPETLESLSQAFKMLAVGFYDLKDSPDFIKQIWQHLQK